MLPQLIVVEAETSLPVKFISNMPPGFLVKDIIWSVAQLDLFHNQVSKYLIKASRPPRS